MNPQLIISLVGALAPIVNNMLAWIEKAQGDLKQNAELTAEQEKELDLYISQIDQPAWWKVQ